jgi:hypothetical protein
MGQAVPLRGGERRLPIRQVQNFCQKSAFLFGAMQGTIFIPLGRPQAGASNDVLSRGRLCFLMVCSSDGSQMNGV